MLTLAYTLERNSGTYLLVLRKHNKSHLIGDSKLPLYFLM